MYKFKTDLNLSHLIKDELIQICIGENELIFNFHSNNSITILGEWSLINKECHEIDKCEEHSNRKAYYIHNLLGKKIEAYNIVNPSQLNLNFEGGYTLEIYDDSDQYESCLISPGIII
jgi:hypothetical protein